ncbi:hypothetical protein [Pseudomonas frederiksbergensis]|uniref:hypothetical protein n=1 Tax=Pseudomonas frederiksbergensis TaxID=104087 RepID=UPI003D1B93EB
MIDAEAKLTELIEDAERLGGKIILLVHAATTGHTLCERGTIALSDFGTDSVQHFHEFEKKLKSYRAACIHN